MKRQFRNALVKHFDKYLDNLEKYPHNEIDVIQDPNGEFYIAGKSSTDYWTT